MKKSTIILYVVAFTIFTSRSSIAQPRVVGGDTISNSQTPHIAALIDTDRIITGASLDQAQFCGGTLIAPTWVLTAAHCLFDANGQRLDPASVSVLLGTTDLNNPVSEPSDVSFVLPHPQFMGIAEDSDTNSNFTDFDIGLLQLVTPSDIPPALLDGTTVIDRELAYIAGWGALNQGLSEAQTFSDLLQGAVVNAYSAQSCVSEFPAFSEFIGNGVVCAYRDNVDTCQGDSGGPLYSLSIYSARVYNVTGITSFGVGCANENFPGVYTSVNFFLDWIREHVPEASVSLVDTSRQSDNPEPVDFQIYPHIDENASLSGLSGLGTGSVNYLILFALMGFYLARRVSRQFN